VVRGRGKNERINKIKKISFDKGMSEEQKSSRIKIEYKKR